MLKALMGIGLFVLLVGGAFLCIKTGAGFPAYLAMSMGGFFSVALGSIVIDHRKARSF